MFFDVIIISLKFLNFSDPAKVPIALKWIMGAAGGMVYVGLVLLETWLLVMEFDEEVKRLSIDLIREVVSLRGGMQVIRLRDCGFVI